VTSYRPLRVWEFKQGFARFTNVKYSTDRDQMNNVEIHLTNVAIQKHGEDYNTKHGNKWNLNNLRTWLEGNFGHERTQECLRRIRGIEVHSLLAVQQNIINDKHCFELYGYDIIIDSDLKPWLIEVNSSPSLSATTKSDRIMKKKLINDTFAVVVPRDFPSIQTSRGCTGWNTTPRVGDFELIYDESSNKNKFHPRAPGHNPIVQETVTKISTKKRKSRNSLWRT